MKRWIQLGLMVMLIGLFIGIVSAQSGYSIAWYTIDGGGATVSSGGSYTLGGTIGQVEAGVVSGGGYTLYSGFWGSSDSFLYVPLVTR
ncbi:hypothetical protein [Chloroflexus sp.]|uniref:hypothetical protein n=1 Tax=Chloroflexus sp. TaxID=1904827 RepID=UPI00298F32AC|nr:hypothetical protein [Chloroflexus sp.]MCS6887170.1 hypothetical protein [Chloroflexus sp.]MDW8404933.1 hypothetical protein [Chloroflexus sp.]